MKLTITMQREGQPPYVVTVPAASVEAGDSYSQRIGLANTEHLICRVLLDQLLVGSVIPNTTLPAAHAAELAAIEAEAAAAKRKLEEQRLAPFLPELSIGGQIVTLPQIEAQLKAAKEAQ